MTVTINGRAIVIHKIHSDSQDSRVTAEILDQSAVFFHYKIKTLQEF